ncbi:hypothetical protein ACTXK7_07105 [Vreelandella alkaliphila]|uniref:hypothetical protein n=1 Tax=Halomonadaceae TaxID=28256 RepID=UPI003F8F1E41
MEKLHSLFKERVTRENQIILAHHMLRMGFINTIVKLETNTPDGKISAQRAALESQGAIKPVKGRGLRNPSSIVRPRRDFRYISNVMLLYMRIHPGSALESVNVPSVFEAYQTGLITFLENNAHAATEDFITINDIYSLAKSFREGECYLQQCPDCYSVSLIVLNLDTHERCAFCKSRDVQFGTIVYGHGSGA